MSMIVWTDWNFTPKGTPTWQIGRGLTFCLERGKDNPVSHHGLISLVLYYGTCFMVKVYFCMLREIIVCTIS